MTRSEHDERRTRVATLLKRNPHMTNVALAAALGTTESSIRRDRKHIKHDKTESRTNTSISAERYKNAYYELKGSYEEAIKLLDMKEQALSKLIEMSTLPKTTDITAHASGNREVVPVIVASDWHIEETVSAAITNGLNEYNLKIAEDSAKQFFSNATYLINRAKLDSEVNTVVLALLGDIINGVLRSEDLENNQTTSIDALTLARSILYSGIKMLAKETGCTIKVICCVGNHGRMTEKIHFSNQVHNSLEYLIYKTLERDFRDHAKVKFLVSEAPYVIQKIFGVRVRFHHGHMAKYNGGIGGLAIPVLRKAAQMNMIEKADLDVIGHFHTMQVFNNVIINGSLVGSNGYSMALGLPHEQPQQTFFLIDSKYGRSMITPIFIDRTVRKSVVEDI